MKRKSVFVLNNEENEYLEKLIKRCGFDITRCSLENLEKIPHNHNFYVLHFSQTTEKAIIELRGEFLGYIYLKSGCFSYGKTKFVPLELRKIINDFGPGYHPVYTLFKNQRRIKNERKLETV